MKKTYLKLSLKKQYMHLNRYKGENKSIHEVIYDEGTILYAGGIRGEVDVLPIDRPWNYKAFDFSVITEEEAFLEML